MKALIVLKDLISGNRKSFTDEMTVCQVEKYIEDAIEELEVLKHNYEMQQILIDDYRESLQSKITRIEVISKLGRDFVCKCDNTKHYELSFQDDNRTLKIFKVKDKE